jgi:periplasmic protein CpxP/Spy
MPAGDCRVAPMALLAMTFRSACEGECRTTRNLLIRPPSEIAAIRERGGMMDHVSNPIARALAAAMVVGGVSLVALAPAVSFAQAAGPGTERSTEPGQTPIAARINYLHEKLQITPAQEPLWADVAQAMRENAEAVAPLIEERAKSATGSNAIDNLGSYEKLGEAQLDGLKKFIAAFQALYASLSDDQKKVADAVVRLGPLNMFGGIPELPEQLVTPAPYPSYPTLPSYRYYPPYPYYAPYAYYPPYPYYAPYAYSPFYPSYRYYNPWLWGPPFGLGASFFFVHRFHHRHVFLAPGPAARVGPSFGPGGFVRHR